MTKLVTISLDQLPDSVRKSLAYESSHAHLAAAGTVSARFTTVLTANTTRAVTLPSAAAPTSPLGTTYTIVKVDSGGSGLVALTPATGEKIGAGIANATWSSPASAINSITLVSDGVDTWTIALQTGTWA